jgi:hypothetical protein
LRRHARNAALMISSLALAAVTIAAIRADAVGDTMNLRNVVLGGGIEPQLHAALTRKLDALRIHVDANDATTACAQHLHGQLTKHSEADDDDRLAKSRVAATHALQRDGAKRHRRGTLRVQSFRNLYRQIDGHIDHFGVIRDARPRTRDSIADRELGDIAADFDHAAAAE